MLWEAILLGTYKSTLRNCNVLAGLDFLTLLMLSRKLMATLEEPGIFAVVCVVVVATTSIVLAE